MSEDVKPYLSVVIPAFNEERRITESLEKVERFLSQQSYSSEIIIVDDCSNDFTYDVIRRFIAGKTNYRLIRNEANVGKGASIKRGMLMAKGDLRLFSDADLSTPIEEVSQFLQFIRGPEDKAGAEKFDIVIGSRRVSGAKVAVRQPFFREAAGRIFSVIVRMLTVRGFIDTQCGFKMFTAAAAEKIFPRQTIPGFGFDVELLFIAKYVMKFRIKEAPVLWTDSPFTRVKLVQDSSRMFWDLLRIRWNYLKGRYSERRAY